MNNQFSKELAVFLTPDVQKELLLALYPGRPIQEWIRSGGGQALVLVLRGNGLLDNHAAPLIQLIETFENPIFDDLLVFCLAFNPNVDRSATPAPPRETGTSIEMPTFPSRILTPHRRGG